MTTDKAAQPLTSLIKKMAQIIADHLAPMGTGAEYDAAKDIAALIDAQAAKPPTVQVDREKVADVIRSTIRAFAIDDKQDRSWEIADALISALPGLTTASRIEPNADDDFAADQAEHWLEDCINGEGWLDSELGSLHNALAVIRRLRSAPRTEPDAVKLARCVIAEHILHPPHSSLHILAREVLRLSVTTAPGAGWRDIASAPKDGKEILVYWQRSPHVPAFCAIMEWPANPDHYEEDFSDITHWMPLPNPPATSPEEK